MKTLLACILLCILCDFSIFAQTTIQNLLCENKSEPLCIDIPQPQFTWILSSNERNTTQTAYQIRVSTKLISLQKGKDLIWESGKITSNQSVHIPYAGTPLASAKKYYWQVKIWDNKGKASDWSQPASFAMGLLKASDWSANWIQPGVEDSVSRPSPLFRKQFTTNKKILSATAFITAHGLYEANLNGQRIGDAYLSPGWTSYNKRLPYQAYDITKLIQNGKNTIAITLGSGWYRGFLAFEGNKNTYGKDIALLTQIQIDYTDGSTQIIASDDSWKSSTGPIQSSEIYNGELYDARQEKQGWTQPDYDDSQWSKVKIANFPKDILVGTQNEPIRKHESFSPKQIIKTPSGDNVIDFGQNLVGWVQIKATGKSGDVIKISHAEVLDKKGNFYTDNLRAAKQQNTFILKGSGQEVFEPHFTFQGFRYIKIEGYSGDLQPENFTAYALYSDMTPTGTFSCSNPLLNQLQHNIQWGQKGNFLDVPTDCPQRDERLGWTGDAQAFSRTATFNMNVDNFFSKWLKDIAADQLPNGSVPFVIPNVLGQNAAGSTGWADAATIIPWNVYLAYGDKRILEQQYESMKRWVGFMDQNSTQYLWNKGFHFGDWLFYSPADDNSGRAAVTDKYLIAQIFYANSTQLVLNAAKVLGKSDDIVKYTDLLKHIKDAFLQEYVTPNGRLVSSTQTAYVLALNFDMLPESLRPQAAEKLVKNIKDYKDHLTTGFLGTPYLCHVLSRFGYNDVAYTLLLQETYPSWLYPVKMGATTIWERWDGQKPDSTFEVPSMNSFNHYAYGAIGDWMYRSISGLDTYESGPGYKEIKIMPQIGGKLTYANATLQTYYGTLSSNWKLQDNKLILDIEIPANTTATVFIPADSPNMIFEGDTSIDKSADIKIKGKEGNNVLLTIGSGKYHFSQH